VAQDVGLPVETIEKIYALGEFEETIDWREFIVLTIVQSTDVCRVHDSLWR
jgi:hypothetical protein